MPPFTQRRRAIDQRTAELGGKTPATIMVACGEVLRMKEPASESARSEAEGALVVLSLQEVETSLASVSAGATRGELKLAMSDAFEAAFADGSEERALYGASAVAGLLARDKVASLCAAARARLALGSENSTQKAPANAALAHLVSEMTALDGELSPQARSLTGINRERRLERDKLTPEEGAIAWWYSARSDEGDDRLLAALGEISPAAGGESLTGAALADLKASGLSKPTRGGIESALRRVALGAASRGERDWLTARVAGDAALQTALSLAEDASLEEAPGD